MSESEKETYKLSDDELIERAMEGYKESRRFSANWRKDARTLYQFRAGHQWTAEEISYLEEQQRPAVVFNRAGTIIDAVVGNEIANRQDIHCYPRTLDDAAVNETATQAIKWVRDQCNAEDEESDMLEDVCICGMGWTETRIDYDHNIDGEIIEERVDPLEMFWKPNAIKQNLEDSDEFWRARWKTKREVKAQWPNADEIVASVDLAPELDETGERNADPPFYERESTGIDDRRDEVRVIEYQWCEYATFYRVANPLSGQVESVNQEQFKKLKERFPNVRAVKQKKKQWYRAFFAGKTLLERGETPITSKSNYKCVTGKRDRKDNSWYGLMRGMKDPQEWANKFFSQILHIINSNSKGGFFWETGALKDPNAAKENMAKPEGMVELNPGGMQKIKERQMFQFPASIDRMLEFAISSIRDVPGVNLELLGAANRDQAGVLEQQRQRQALAVLAPIFNNLRRFRKEQGRLILDFIRTYIADGRLIRIVGENGPQTVPLLKDQLSSEYDIIVDQSPSSPNMKTEAWIALTNVLPVLTQANFPIPKEIVDILPLPDSVIGKWKEAVKNGPQIPPEMQEQIQQMQQENQELKQQNMDLQQKHDIKVAEFQAKHQIATQEIQLQQAQAESQAQIDTVKHQQDIALRHAEAEAEIQLKTRQIEAELAMKRQEMEAELAMKVAELEAEFSLKERELQQNAKFKQMEIDATVTEDQVKSADSQRGDMKKLMEQIMAKMTEAPKPKKFSVQRDKRGFIANIVQS